MPQEVNVGLIGYSFMGKVHSHAFKDMSFFFPEAAAYPVMKAICGRNEANVSDAAKTFGWQGYETDWKTLIGRDDIHLIDVSTPGDSHAEIAIAAAEAGKHVFCEKPLANNLAEARAMADAERGSPALIEADIAMHKAIGLSPEKNFRQLTVIPPVPHNAMLPRKGPGQKARLNGACHRRKYGL